MNYNLFFAADAELAMLQGRLNVDLDTSAYFNMSSGVYAFKRPVLGGRFAMGGTLPLGYADLESQLVGPTDTTDVDGSELLRLTRLHEVFETFRDEQEALASF